MTTSARLRAFVAVADTGSVRLAAQRLVLTESAVSAAIAALTRSVGVPLVARQGRGLRLTAAGDTFAGYARTILGMQDEAIAAARSEVDPERGRVRLAAVTTAADHLLPAALGGFLRRHPDVDLRLEVGSSEQVWALFEAHETDVVIAGRPPRGRTGVIAATRPNELVAVAAPGPAADADPARTRWLLREPGSGTRATCETLLAELDADPPRLTLGSNGAVVAGAVAGLGVTLVSRDAVAHRLASGELRVVDLPGTPMIRPWHLVVHQPLPAGATLFVDHLLRHADPTGARWQPPAPPRRGPGGSPARPARPAR